MYTPVTMSSSTEVRSSSETPLGHGFTIKIRQIRWPTVSAKVAHTQSLRWPVHDVLISEDAQLGPLSTVY